MIGTAEGNVRSAGGGRLARLLGELLVTVGAILVLFVAWELWWSDVVADADPAEVVAAMEQEPSGRRWIDPRSVAPGDPLRDRPDPTVWADYARPLYEGTTPEVLSHGLGHYVGTSLPGDVGNVGIAGHRTTYGRPLSKIELADDDVVLLETRQTYFLYRVASRQIVPPDRVSVLLPVPDSPGRTPTVPILTLTTCHPEFSAKERYIVHARLVGTYPRAIGVPPGTLEVDG